MVGNKSHSFIKNNELDIDKLIAHLKLKDNKHKEYFTLMLKKDNVKQYLVRTIKEDMCITGKSLINMLKNTFPLEHKEISQKISNTSESNDTKKSILGTILSKKETLYYEINNARGKLGESLYFLIPINNDGWEYVIIFSKGLIKEIKEKHEEDEVTYFIELTKEDCNLLGLQQTEVLINLDISVKDIDHKQIASLYHLDIGNMGNSFFEVLSSIAEENNGKIKLKEKYTLKSTSTIGTPENILGELYREFEEVLRQFYYHKDFFYPVAFSLYVSELIKHHLGYVYLIMLNGISGSGKSNLMKFICGLFPCSYYSNSGSTIKAAVRMMDLYDPITCFDEMDKIGTGEAKKMICGIINNSIDIGGNYTIAKADEKKKKNQIQVYNTFGAKCIAMNNIKDIEESTVSRSFLFTSISNMKFKGHKWESVMRSNSVNPKLKERFIALTHKLFWTIFLNAEEISSKINNIQKSKVEQSREEDRYSLLEGTLSFFKDKKEIEQIINQIKEYEESTAIDTLHPVIRNAIDLLLDKSIRPNGGYIHYRSSDVVERLNTDMYANNPEKQWSPNSPFIRNKLIEFNLIENEFMGKGKYKTYEISLETLFEIIESNKLIHSVFKEDDRINMAKDRMQRRKGNLPTPDDIGEVEETDLSGDK